MRTNLIIHIQGLRLPTQKDERNARTENSTSINSYSSLCF